MKTWGREVKTDSAFAASRKEELSAVEEFKIPDFAC